jgi:hypothetical protein
MKCNMPMQATCRLADNQSSRKRPAKIKLAIIGLIISATACISSCNKLIQTPISPLSLITFNDEFYVVSTFPADGAIDIPTSASVQAVFTYDIEFSSINSSTFVVADDLYRPIDGFYSYDAASKTVTFTPSSSLLNLSKYNGLITTDVIDPGGQRIAWEKIWYFTTISTGTIPDPSLSLASGTYEGAQYVAIQCQDPGASIRYTLDGTAPSSMIGSIYGNPITITDNTASTIRAIAYRSGFTDSSISSATYTIKVMTPILDKPAGDYISYPTVTITVVPTIATIKYTMDGSDPSPTNGSTLSNGGSFAVSGTSPVTVKAMAYAPNTADSSIVTAVYSLNLAQVAAPVFTPQIGMYTPPPNLSVSLSTTTAGATIKYTTDGTNPSPTNGTVGTTVAIADTEVLKAYAYKAGMTDSSITNSAGSWYIIAPKVNSISPNKGPNLGPITVTIKGNNFKAGAVAKLTNAGYPDIAASSLNLVDSGTIICTFDITGAAQMKWNLIVTNTDGGISTNLKYFRIY